jgi:adenylylsulfate kinase-like enzyme
MSGNFNHMIPTTLKSTILIEIRNTHTAKIAEELVSSGIVPNEYLDKLLLIDMINQLKTQPADGFNNLQRIAKLTQLLQKHSISSTASFISNLYS